MILASSFNMFETILKVFGGLGIFLFGINLMGDGLKALAGNKMKLIIEKSTNTPLKGILVGILVTGLIQSSSGTTALTVGLVRAGLMTFPQAVGVIMGANIGTTVTSLLIGLKVEEYSMVFIGVGALFCFFAKKKFLKELGSILLGFGFLFFGLGEMGSGLKAILIEYETMANHLFSSLSRWPILGLLIGGGLTAVIQSSSASIGILQGLYETGQIQLVGALPILLGCNIGTTVTAILAASGGSIEAKRTAVVHTLFNVIGATLFLVCLTFAYEPLISYIETNFLATPEMPTPSMTIAVAHAIFNILATFILYFFIKQMCAVAVKIFPDKANNNTGIMAAVEKFSLIESPTLALELVKNGIDYMGELTANYFHLAKSSTFANKGELDSEQAEEFERNINSYDKKLHDYLVRLTSSDLTQNESRMLSKYLDAIKDLERIGDHCTNIVEFNEERFKLGLKLSDQGVKELEEMYSILEDMVISSIDALIENDKSKAQLVTINEETIDELEVSLREKHLQRVEQGLCDYQTSDHYADMLSNLERIGDHSYNIAMSVIDTEYWETSEFDH